MCGICGIVGKTKPGLIQEMTDAVYHRGPDDDGYYHNSSAGVDLGMRRLSIIDLETGKQPIYNEDGSIVIVFNGEIYDYQELRRSLINKGHRFRTKSDTEAIIHGYEEYGPDVVKYLTGMFAFAIWDDHKKQLFLARDRLGIKPLYYTSHTDRFLFASEVKCLFQDSMVPHTLNPRAMCEYMLFGFLSGDEQPIAGIRMLLPGCYGIFSPQDGLKIVRYWDAADFIDNRYALEEAAFNIRETLKQVVASHMIADVEVGLTLSGGLDSTLVLTYMAQFLGEKASNITAFTTGYGLPSDEFPAARKTAGRYAISTYESILKFEDSISLIPSIIWHVEEPIPHVTNFSNYFWSRIIKEKLKVVQIGEGSDELFGGYAQYRIFDFPWSLMPSWTKKNIFHMGYLMPMIGEVNRLMNPQITSNRLVEEVYQNDYLDELKRSPNLFDAFLLFEIRNELPNSQLLRVDKLMMAHSVEARVPFLDHHFVELALAVDYRYKRFQGIEKYVLRKAAEYDLPKDIAFKRKYGRSGSQPIMQEIMNRGLMEVILNAYRSGQLNTHKIFDKKMLERYIYNEIRLPIFGTRMRDKLLIFVLFVEVWSRLFLDQSCSSSDPEMGVYDLLKIKKTAEWE
jgi:asparagine synthase (glutamine-hydrolysing)